MGTGSMNKSPSGLPCSRDLDSASPFPPSCLPNLFYFRSRVLLLAFLSFQVMINSVCKRLEIKSREDAGRHKSWSHLTQGLKIALWGLHLKYFKKNALCIVLVFSNCYLKTKNCHRLDDSNAKHSFLTVLAFGKSKIKAHPDLVCGEVLFSGSEMANCYVLTWQEKRALLSLLYKGTNPIHKGSTIMT